MKLLLLPFTIMLLIINGCKKENNVETNLPSVLPQAKFTYKYVNTDPTNFTIQFMVVS